MDGNAGALSAEPELREFQLAEEDEFLILASDGFWKMHASNQAAIKEARRRLRKQLSPRAVADELVSPCLAGFKPINLISVVHSRLPEQPLPSESKCLPLRNPPHPPFSLFPTVLSIPSPLRQGALSLDPHSACVQDIPSRGSISYSSLPFERVMCLCTQCGRASHGNHPIVDFLPHTS